MNRDQQIGNTKYEKVGEILGRLGVLSIKRVSMNNNSIFKRT